MENDDDLAIQKLIDDFNSVDISEKDHIMVEYVYKLTKTPHEITKNDIDLLRKSGFKYDDILNINLIACYFNFVNRIALGLGVEFSQDESSGYKY